MPQIDAFIDAVELLRAGRDASHAERQQRDRDRRMARDELLSGYERKRLREVGQDD